MFIQGNLQAVFDALYTMGIIEPVLKMDWQQIHKQMETKKQTLKSALRDLNLCLGDQNALVATLKMMDSDTVNFVALEVARELAEFTDRKVLH